MLKNKTDLPCVTFEEYYKMRVDTISEQIKWFQERIEDNSYWRKVVVNLTELLEGLPEELGYHG